MMKTRNGWVSNSSSSSFIVAFPKRLEDYSEEEFCELLYGDQKVIFSMYREDCAFKAIDLARYVKKVWVGPFDAPLRDREQENALLQIVKSGYFEGYPEPPDGIYWNDDKEEMYRKRNLYYEVLDATAQRRLRDFLMNAYIEFADPCGNAPRPFFYVFEFSDNDGAFFSELEHGQTFDKVPHMMISRH